MTEADIQLAEEILDQADEAIEAGDHQYGYDLGAKFHKFLAEKVGNQRLRKTVNQIEERVSRVRPLIWRHGEAPIDRSAQHYRQILNAIKGRDGRKAEELMGHHTVWFEEELTVTLQQVLG